MNEGFQGTPDPEDFQVLMNRLRQRDARAWHELVGRLRKTTLPWLRKRVGTLPDYAVVSEQEFVLEIFAESLAKFYTLFEIGHFSKPAELQSLLFKVAELKMREGFARLRKEALIYRPADPADFQTAKNDIRDWTHDDDLARQRAQNIQRYLLELSENDRSLLCRYYAGEKLTDLAREMNVSEEIIRKRKQRAFDRLKQLLGPTLMLLMISLWIAR